MRQTLNTHTHARAHTYNPPSAFHVDTLIILIVVVEIDELKLYTL